MNRIKERLCIFKSVWSFKFFRFKNIVLPNLRSKVNRSIACDVQSDQPFYLTGAGYAEIREGVRFGYRPGGFFHHGSIEIQPRTPESAIIIGERVTTNNNLFICAANHISIGADTLIGQYVTIMDHEAHGIRPEDRRKVGKIGEVIIGSNVWIGNNVVILKDTYIGDNTVVAAGAIVSGHFPANAIIGGVPAKFIKYIDEQIRL